jgi:hypothetical protein
MGMLHSPPLSLNSYFGRVLADSLNYVILDVQASGSSKVPEAGVSDHNRLPARENRYGSDNAKRYQRDISGARKAA